MSPVMVNVNFTTLYCERIGDWFLFLTYQIMHYLFLRGVDNNVQ